MKRGLLAGILAAVAAITAVAGSTAASAAPITETFAQLQAGQASAFSMPELARKMAEASRRASLVLGHPVMFDAPDVGRGSFKQFADAADLTAQAFEDSSLVLNGREKTISITRVLFVEGDRPDVQLQGDLLRISIAARKGLAGPASERIFHLLTTQATV